MVTRALFALPGIHRIQRGAEVAMEAVADQLSRRGHRVTVAGGGPPRTDRLYDYIQIAHRGREYLEWLPTFPPVRSELQWEELGFAIKLGAHVHREDYDVTVTCAFPFIHWQMQRLRMREGPRHVFVTQNGDWPAISDDSEFRFFGCDGLVCTNPEFFDRNERNYNCRLIPNGVDELRFFPGPPVRAKFGIPTDVKVVLMVSALMPYKRVAAGIDAIARVPGAHLVVAGDGPLRDEVEERASRMLRGRFTRLTIDSTAMPDLYRSADAVLHMALDEPFGNVFVEGLASGLPVVANDTASTEWLLGSDGYRMDASSSGAVVEALVAALSEADGARQNARAARCHARFSWSKIADAYGTFLDEVAGVARD